MRKWVAIALFAAVAAEGAVDYPSRPPKQSIDAHDPAIFKDDDGTYYVYATHNMPTWKSKDLITFESVSRRLVPNAPEEAKEHVGGNANDMWAPDLVKIGDEYRLYYCLSKFGSTQSYIGFMTSDSPTGPFKGEDNKKITASVSPSPDRKLPNALDPSILVDEDNKQWMVYGSFFGGIYLMPLDKDGTPKDEDSVGERVAYRRRSAMEGPCLLYNPTLKQYYLFYSHDKLDSTYNVRVGRSKKPGGPYKDFNDVDMNGDEDNLPNILNSYAFENHRGWDGPGHNSVLRDGDNYFMLHHARERGRVHTHVRKMVFTDEGWPVVSPERYAGEKEQAIPEKEMMGSWEWLPIDPKNNQLQKAKTGLVFEEKGVVRFGEEKGKWEMKQPNSLRIKLGDRPVISAKILPAWDWENENPTLVFTGLDKDGTAVWGKKRKAEEQAEAEEKEEDAE